MSLPVNGARGEVALTIGTTELVIAAEMGRLSAVSTALGCMSISDLYQRLMGAEVAAVMAGIQHMTVRGSLKTAGESAAAALATLKLKDFPACKDAFTKALSHHLEDDEGKDGAAGEAAGTTS